MITYKIKTVLTNVAFAYVTQDTCTMMFSDESLMVDTAVFTDKFHVQ